MITLLCVPLLSPSSLFDWLPCSISVFQQSPPRHNYYHELPRPDAPIARARTSGTGHRKPPTPCPASPPRRPTPPSRSPGQGRPATAARISGLPRAGQLNTHSRCSPVPPDLSRAKVRLVELFTDSNAHVDAWGHIRPELSSQMQALQQFLGFGELSSEGDRQWVRSVVAKVVKGEERHYYASLSSFFADIRPPGKKESSQSPGRSEEPLWSSWKDDRGRTLSRRWRGGARA
jgi:hypothetical protein